jgi:hypothetical protein
MKNQLIKDILIGTLLGDAHIRRAGLTKAYVTFEQSLSKKDYLNFIHSHIKSGGIALNDPKIYERIDTRYNKINQSLYLRTKALEELSHIADMFLNEDNKKVVPSNIVKHLNYRSLAYWIMDDGQQVKRGGVTLCTDSYSSDEVNLLKFALESKFNIFTTIHKKKGKEDSIYDRIYIGKSSLDNLKPYLKEHMHESLLYKINAEVEKTSNL